MLRAALLTCGFRLMMSEAKTLFFGGMLLVAVASLLGASEQKAAKGIPYLLLFMVSFMAMTFGDVYDPQPGKPLAIRYHNLFVPILFGAWAGTLALDYRKWRASRSDKQAE